MNVKGIMIAYTIITVIYAVIVFGFSLNKELSNKASTVFAVWVLTFLIVNSFVYFKAE